MNEDEPMRFTSSARVFIALTAALVASSSQAADGQREINQTCVVSGCFPGDAPGFPVTITTSGSYRLTSDLSQTFVPGVTSATDAIVVEASRVHVELGGFSIACTNPLSPSDPCGGSGHGITTGTGIFDGISVSNGTILGMPDDGVALGSARAASVRDVRVVGNGGNGVRAGNASTVAAVSAFANGGSGIWVSGGSTVSRCTAQQNGSTGIRAQDGSLVSNSSAVSNSGGGIALADGSLAHENVSRFNSGAGIVSGGLTFNAYRGNLISNNGNTVVGSPVDAGGNTCSLFGGCP